MIAGEMAHHGPKIPTIGACTMLAPARAWPQMVARQGE